VKSTVAACRPTFAAWFFFSLSSGLLQWTHRRMSFRVVRPQVGHGVATEGGTATPSRLKSTYQATGPVRSESSTQTQKRRFLSSEAHSPTTIAITIQSMPP